MPNKETPPELQELKDRMERISSRHEQLHSELVNTLLSDPLVSEEFKMRMLRDQQDFEEASRNFDDYLMVNRGKKLKGIDPKTFMPLFSNEEDAG